ncbi:hypothetical protein O3M35_012192 [Rhynocoris fuscipes]|uniref:Amine oxidase n=1 Tax=Rhynocoris fuscipes TaxID=488301 RepID=A0AAW1CY05_9HEMI
MKTLENLRNCKEFIESVLMRSTKCFSDGAHACSQTEAKPVIGKPTMKCERQRPCDCLNIAETFCPCPEICKELPKVVIIGAGISGLTAAKYLMNWGFRNVTILEASNRLGGRICTKWMCDAAIELGADRIHGASITNPLFTLAMQEDLFRETGVQRVDNYNYDYLTTDGRFVSEHETEDMVFNQLLKNLNTLLKRGCSSPEISLLHYLSLNTDQTLLQIPSNMRYEAERILFGMIQSLKPEFGADLNDINAVDYAKIPKIEGVDIIMPAGFVNLLAPAIRTIPEECMHCNKCVEKIMWNADSNPRIQIRCSDDSHYDADFAIITIPLGALKRTYNSLFTPTLEQSKINAIKNLGFGQTNKIFFEYVKPWWASGKCQFRMACSKNDSAKWPKWIKGISTISQVPGSKHVISIPLGGEEAKLIEEMSLEEIAIDFTNFLRALLHNNAIQYPNNVCISRWSNNPNFYGARTYIKLGSSIDQIRNISDVGMIESLLDIPPLLFAGEHTHPNYFGTVHGALISGYREAKRILDYTKAKISSGLYTVKSEETWSQEEEACA